jgi:hypothetical protein
MTYISLPFNSAPAFLTPESVKRSRDHHAVSGFPVLVGADRVGAAVPVSHDDTALTVEVRFDESQAGREAAALYGDGALTTSFSHTPKAAEVAIRALLLHAPGFGPGDLPSHVTSPPAVANRAHVGTEAPTPQRTRADRLAFIAKMDEQIASLKT